MQIDHKSVTTRTFTVTLTDSEAEYLVEMHDTKGLSHFPINHVFCADPRCVSCGIVKAVRAELRKAKSTC